MSFSHLIGLSHRAVLRSGYSYPMLMGWVLPLYPAGTDTTEGREQSVIGRGVFLLGILVKLPLL